MGIERTRVEALTESMKEAGHHLLPFPHASVADAFGVVLSAVCEDPKAAGRLFCRFACGKDERSLRFAAALRLAKRAALMMLCNAKPQQVASLWRKVAALAPKGDRTLLPGAQEFAEAYENIGEHRRRLGPLSPLLRFGLGLMMETCAFARQGWPIVSHNRLQFLNQEFLLTPRGRAAIDEILARGPEVLDTLSQHLEDETPTGFLKEVCVEDPFFAGIVVPVSVGEVCRALLFNICGPWEPLPIADSIRQVWRGIKADAEAMKKVWTAMIISIRDAALQRRATDAAIAADPQMLWRIATAACVHPPDADLHRFLTILNHLSKHVKESDRQRLLEWIKRPQEGKMLMAIWIFWVKWRMRPQPHHIKTMTSMVFRDMYEYLPLTWLLDTYIDVATHKEKREVLLLLVEDSPFKVMRYLVGVPSRAVIERYFRAINKYDCLGTGDDLYFEMVTKLWEAVSRFPAFKSLERPQRREGWQRRWWLNFTPLWERFKRTLPP